MKSAVPLHQKVVERVAEANDVEPSDIDTPLHAAVDTDALNEIFNSKDEGFSRDEGKIQFPYCGYKVVVSAEGDVRLYNVD